MSEKLIIKDEVHGLIELEGAYKELAESKDFQRLKDIKSSNQMDKVDMKLIRGLISEKGIQRFSFIKIILLVDSIFPIH